MRSFRKSVSLAVAATLLALSATVPAQAWVPGYYFVQTCGSASPNDCPLGANPWYIGPYTTLGACTQAAVEYWYWIRFPYSLSNCWYISTSPF